ncbi:Histone-lysine N-methyltransferase SETMAR, partial [Habropoda laboriosa]
GHNAAAAARNINAAFGNDTVDERTVRRWSQKFEAGDESLVIEARGRPEPSINDDQLQISIEANTRQTVRDLAQEFSVSPMTISRHLKSIGKVKKLDKWVPHELNERQKLQRQDIRNSLLIRNGRDPFLDRIVTCDEKWILYDNRRRSAQWLDADESPRHMPKPALHPRKIMITLWWSMAGGIHYNFLRTGETINAEKYCAEIEAMHQKLRVKQPALANRKGPIVLHDNARPHISQITVQNLNTLKYETLPHSPYLPDLSLTDYHFFKHLNHFLNEKTFMNQETVENAFKQLIVTKPPNFYKNGIQKLLTNLKKCVESNGSYFD